MLREQNTSLDITLKSPEGHADVVEPSTELYNAVLDLYALFQRYGHSWKGVTYKVALQPEGDWRLEADFSY